jgi:hypothetical protein
MGRHHYGGASVIGRSGGVAASALSAGSGSAGVTGGGPHPEWMAPPGYMSKQAKTGNMARERRVSEGNYEAVVRAGLILTGYPTFWAREGKKPRRDDSRHRAARQGSIPTLREHQSALVTGKEVTPWPQ